MRRIPFLFRCDGSPEIGMGHVRRCVALALALRDLGGEPVFVMRPIADTPLRVVEQAGFAVERVAGALDTAFTVDRAMAVGARCVVVDHYGATPADFRQLRAAGFQVAVIDDLADRDLGAANWVLNQNPDAVDMSSRVSPECRVLRGPAYALLRPEFSRIRQSQTRKFSANDRQVLVTFGGGATADTCAEVLVALNQAPRSFVVQCVLGGEGAATAGLDRAVADSKHEIRIIRNAENMADLMAAADVSVNAAGSTCWELCCLGVPMAILALAPNQAPNASALVRSGCACLAGFASQSGAIPETIAPLVTDLLTDPRRRSGMSARGRELVDGLGAHRAAQTLMDLSVTEE